MTPQLEKIFFNYIRKNKKYFNVVYPYFFRNSEIQYVYEILRDYVLSSEDVEVPTPVQYFDMIQLKDKEGVITKEIFKSILKIELSEYSEDKFILPKFNAWVLANRIKRGAIDIVDQTRGLDLDSAIETANKIKEITEEMSSLNFINDDDDYGSDFDDYDSHNQDSSSLKVSSGFETIDHMLGKGWDQASFNCIMSETNNGKCSSYDTIIKIRNKNTNKIEDIKIGDLFTKIKLNNKSI